MGILRHGGMFPDWNEGLGQQCQGNPQREQTQTLEDILYSRYVYIYMT